MKGNKVLISILVPTYNRVEYLEECLDSIVEQDWFDLKELELIVSDNSEWDETKHFMEQYIKDHRNWNIIYNKNKENLWMVWNWNKLLELKKWEYYVFLSDDDKFYCKTSLKILYDNLIKYGLDACYWKYRVINWKWDDQWDFIPHSKIWTKKIYYDSFNNQLIHLHSISFWGVLYKSYWFKYDYNSKWYADWNMNLQYLHAKKKIAMINEYTFWYRVHGTNDSNNIPTLYFLESLSHQYEYFHINLFRRVGYFVAMIFLGFARKLKRFFKIV